MPFLKTQRPSHWTFSKPNEVEVNVGGCSVKAWNGRNIPIDGRHYTCAGRLFLPCGVELRASFRIQTTSFDFLERNTVYVEFGDYYYRPEEPELAAALGTTAEGVIPYKWLPDRPLDYRDLGPYPMDWHDKSARLERQAAERAQRKFRPQG